MTAENYERELGEIHAELKALAEGQRRLEKSIDDLRDRPARTLTLAAGVAAAMAAIVEIAWRK